MEGILKRLQGFSRAHRMQMHAAGAQRNAEVDDDRYLSAVIAGPAARYYASVFYLAGWPPPPVINGQDISQAEED